MTFVKNKRRKTMEEIAKLLFKTYENARKTLVFSEGYENAIDTLCKSLNKQQHGLFLDFEMEIYQSFALLCTDVILYLLQLLYPQE